MLNLSGLGGLRDLIPKALVKTWSTMQRGIEFGLEKSHCCAESRGGIVSDGRDGRDVSFFAGRSECEGFNSLDLIVSIV